MRRIDQVSKSKLAHFIQITHRDEVETPITGWLREAYELSDALGTGGNGKRKSKAEKKATACKT